MHKNASFRSPSKTARLKLAIYYVQRMVTSRTVRHVVNRSVLGILRTLHGNVGLNNSNNKHSLAEHLTKTGCIELGKLLSREQCAEILDYLDGQYMTEARGNGSKFRINEVPRDVKLGDYPLETIANCPHVLEIANHPEIIRLVASYLGFKPTIANLGLRWSFPSTSAADIVQSYHRDSEFSSVKVLIYLTDVDHLSGPHAYVTGTHRERMPWRLRPYTDNDIAKKYGSGVVIKGLAGTGIIMDPKGIHKGATPTRRARLLLGIHYSLLPCFLYEYSPVKCMRAGQFDPYINRLMIRQDPEKPAPVADSMGETDQVFNESY